jgi:hypothetical protein
MWWICFVFIHENKIMKPVEIVLRGKGGIRESDGDVCESKVGCKYIYKYVLTYL